MNRLRLVAVLYFIVLLFAASLNYLPFIPVEDGKTFGIFALDIYDDALHLVSALWAGIAAWLGARAARTPARLPTAGPFPPLRHSRHADAPRGPHRAMFLVSVPAVANRAIRNRCLS